MDLRSFRLRQLPIAQARCNKVLTRYPPSYPKAGRPRPRLSSCEPQQRNLSSLQVNESDCPEPGIGLHGRPVNPLTCMCGDVKSAPPTLPPSTFTRPCLYRIYWAFSTCPLFLCFTPRPQIFRWAIDIVPIVSISQVGVTRHSRRARTSSAVANPYVAVCLGCCHNQSGRPPLNVICRI